MQVSADLDLSRLERIIVCGGETSHRAAGIALIDESVLAQAAEPGARLDCAPPDLEPRDLAAVLYTSGTTGLSKGVQIPYAQLATAGQAAHGYLKADDRIYIFTPLFHTVGISAVFATLNKGASLHLAESFQAPTFWQDVRRTGCNRILGLISSMTSYLAKAVPPDERCPFDFAMMSPITAETVAFAQKQGFDYFAAYSMTELSVPLLSPVNSTVLGSCGRPRTGIECRINRVCSSCEKCNVRPNKALSIALFRITQEALTNVARHSGASWVEIEFLCGEDEVVLSIIDNGRGMMENDTDGLAHIGILGIQARAHQLGGQLVLDAAPGGGVSLTVVLPLDR